MTSIQTVFFANELAVKNGLPQPLLGVPFIIDEEGRLEEQMTSYLWARRNGDWAASYEASPENLELHGRKVLRSTLTYIRNRAYHLDVLRRWMRKEELSIADIGTPELDQFADELEDGSLTKQKGRHNAASINQYLGTALDYLRFGHTQGWRGPLHLATRPARKSGHPRDSRSVPIVMRRVNPEQIKTWYSEEQIGEFIENFGTAGAKLCAQIIFKMGLRISEALDLTTDMFPTLEQWRRDRAKQVIRLKGKGSKWRNVPIDEALLSRVHAFIGFERKMYLRRLNESTNRLIIDRTRDGNTRLPTPRAMQKEFAEARRLAGFENLSPHILRHHYAAHYLLRAYTTKLHLSGIQPNIDLSVAEQLLSIELILLMKNLGHSSLDTTMKYLLGLGFLLRGGYHTSYSDMLDPEEY